MTRLGRGLPLVFAGSVPLGWWLGAGPIALPALLLAGFILADCAIARPLAAFGRSSTALRYRLVPWIAIELQLAVMLWGAVTASRLALPGLLGLALAVGTMSGIFGLIAAHDLVHSRDRSERALGLTLLTALHYRHFRIAHLVGHHRWAATEHDPTTARLGESAYGFLVRSIAGQLAIAWRFERRRLAGKRRRWRANRVVQDAAIAAAILLALGAALGWRAVLFQAVQAALAVVLLELFNYVAHYGLMRARRPDGRYEAMTAAHAWNSRRLLNNLALLNMGHHSDHHRAPAAAYQALRAIAQAPELPAGYAGTVLLALLPPLWRRIMHPRIAAYCATAAPRMAPSVACSTTATRS
jgi:alkane 1-monooxygenase